MAGRKAIERLGPFYGATVVNATQMGRYVKPLLEQAGSEFWTYDCNCHGYNPDYARCYAGLYSWNAGVKGNYIWAYTHAHWDERDHYTVEPDGSVKVHIGRWHSRVLPGTQGPIPTIGWEARRGGVDDYRYLQLVREKAARADADPQIVDEVAKWFVRLGYLVPWDDLMGRYHLLVPENGDFDVMDFFNPYPLATPAKYDAVRDQAADFITALGGQER